MCKFLDVRSADQIDPHQTWLSTHIHQNRINQFCDKQRSISVLAYSALLLVVYCIAIFGPLNYEAVRSYCFGSQSITLTINNCLVYN